MSKFNIQDSFAVANFVIDTAKEKNKPVTNLKLQKILFFLQGYSLLRYNSILFNGTFSKWKYGPVEEDIYQEFKSSGSSPIEGMALTIDFNDTPFLKISDPKKTTRESVGNDQFFTKLKRILTELLNIDAWELVEMTHRHYSWSNFENEILSHSAENYSNKEILDCYKSNEGRLLSDAT